VNSDVTSILEFVQGPVFRFAFALMLLGFLRLAVMSFAEAASAWLLATDRRTVHTKLRQRVMWFLLPHMLLRHVRDDGAGWSAYHLILSVCSLVFRLGAIIVPCFMVAHVYLWERALGISWPCLPPGTGDAISFLTIGAGFVVFLGRLYSPLLRKAEPAWSFLTPLILILPFITGVVAMHPRWSPIRYQVVLLLHVLSACTVFVLLPFSGLLSFMHCSIMRWLPQAAWRDVHPPAQPAPKTVGEMVSR
jgi:hypothetical protein